MSTERTSSGDPARTLQLLWRDSSPDRRRGPRRGLSVDAVVEAATAVADPEGLDAVTMRRVARELGVVPMTLYTYVPGKSELLDLMLDAAYARMPRTDTTGQPWRRRVTAVAEENKALFERHPWAAAVSTARPPLGPGQMSKYEHELSALDGLGLGDVEMDDCLTHLLTFVQACARAVADTRAAQHDSALDDRQWWELNAPLLARVLDENAYPTAVRVGAAAGAAHSSAHNPAHAYAFGLQRVLDAFAALIERSGDTKTSTPSHRHDAITP
ncbi:TetR/AcrR family transcriptional regulator [Streptomyces sp. NBC_01754]|uniref:TetR/AcrR family transcriptional regulator n=1 Tax=Streptomyces sp. NBC_01754 TaxID=2975930 RepID=UPI002DD9AE9A|nr:TetR/AcrR family transcriptional regulator [Streptomyces sp. NBC_01754]WSC91606.1 TetR/AcrR family transcriptional regulator [Streptomyces sp. NBC_01754]